MFLPAWSELDMMLRSQGLTEGSVGQAAMVRPDANLGLIFVTDEDDCSAATNDGIFADNPSLGHESPSLRCAYPPIADG